MGGGAEVGAFLDLISCACQLRRIASEQAVELTFEPDTSVFGDGFFAVLDAHHCRKVITARFAFGDNTEQGQGLNYLSLRADIGDFALNIGGQLTASAADQFVSRQ
ncbi:hypothetical protein D3C81_2063090 [compost metagenome]